MLTEKGRTRGQQVLLDYLARIHSLARAGS